jgi:hypothetical protein
MNSIHLFHSTETPIDKKQFVNQYLSKATYSPVLETFG